MISLTYIQVVGNKYYINIFFSFTANLKHTPSERQMYLQGCMYPRLTTYALDQCFSTSSPRPQVSPRKALAESVSTGDMQVSVMPSDNNNFAVSYGIYTLDVVWS